MTFLLRFWVETSSGVARRGSRTGEASFKRPSPNEFKNNSHAESDIMNISCWKDSFFISVFGVSSCSARPGIGLPCSFHVGWLPSPPDRIAPVGIIQAGYDRYIFLHNKNTHLSLSTWRVS
jgi:hypothetical protein